MLPISNWLMVGCRCGTLPISNWLLIDVAVEEGILPISIWLLVVGGMGGVEWVVRVVWRWLWGRVEGGLELCLGGRKWSVVWLKWSRSGGVCV
mgnify:CR=1 FL=1